MQHRRVSFYVEWIEKKHINEICQLLISSGAMSLFVDEDMDEQYIPGQSFMHAHTVFRFRMERTIPTHELLIDLAMQPYVYSAGEINRLWL